MKKLKFKMIFLPVSMIVLVAYYFISAFKNINSSQILLNVIALAVIIIAILPNLKQRIYRDKLNFSVTGLGIIINLLIAVGLYSDSGDYSVFFQRLGLSIGGILIGGGSLYVMGLIGDFLFKKESVGGGDVKLIAGVGSLIGPSAVWLAPLWIPSAILFFIIYKIISAMVKKYADSSVPSAPIHFTSLICLLFIQLELINPIVVGLILFFNIYAAYVIASPSGQFDDSEEKATSDPIDVYAIVEKTCHKCNKSNDAKAIFCGFCGEKLSDGDPSSAKKKKLSYGFKQISFVAVFLLYLGVAYLPGMGQVIAEFHERSIELKIPVSEFQTYFIDSLKFIFDLIFSAFFVGLFAYWFKGLRTWIYLLIGLLLKYWFALILTCVYVIRGQLSFDNFPESILYVLIIQIFAVLIGAFVGAKVATKHAYSDERDRTRFFFCGLSKKFWFIITIAYNPILQFLSKLSVFYFYTASKSLAEVKDWAQFFTTGAFVGVLIVVLIPFVLFAISLKLFFIGIEAVKNKTTKLRKFKIAIFLIAIPLLIILIPLIRNRTWFF